MRLLAPCVSSLMRLRPLRRAGRRLAVEALEDRRVLAPIVDGAIAPNEYEFREDAQNGVSFFFDADSDNFYFGATGIDLNVDNLHIAFLNGDGTTDDAKFAVDFDPTLWTYNVSLFGANDVCYYAFDDPPTCQQQGSSFHHFAGFDGNRTSELAIPRNFLGSNLTNDRFQVSAWAANNAGDFVFATSPASNPTGAAPVPWGSHGSFAFPTTSVSLLGNVLTIKDIRGGTNDTLTFGADAANRQFVISDLNQILTTSIANATGDGTHSITVPFDSISEIEINTGGGDDLIAIDSLPPDLAANVTISGGIGSDTVSLNTPIGLTNSNTFAIDSEVINSASGTIALVGGTFQVSNANVIDDAMTLLIDGATFDMGSNTETVAQLRLVSGTINGGGSSLNGTNDFLVESGTINARLGGGVGLVKSTVGAVTLNGANLFSGGVKLSEGTLEVGNDAALGSASVTINDANTGTADTSLLAITGGLAIANDIVVGNEGTGVVTIGTTGGGAATEYTGSVRLNRASTIQAEHATRFRGRISGTPGAITVTGGSQVDWFNDNSFEGNVFIVGAGTTLQVGTETGANQVPDTANVDVGIGSTLRTAFSHTGDGETIGSLSGGGTVSTNSDQAGTSILKVGITETSSTFSGSIIDGDADSLIALTKVGPGIQTLSGINTYSGETKISTGHLLIDGSITSNVNVNGGVLGGGGTVNAAVSMSTSGGAIAPSASAGTTTGQLSISGNVALHSAGRMQVELNGTTAGSEYDQLRLTGTESEIDLAGVDLELTIGFTPATGDSFTIIDNVDPMSTVTGIFEDFANGTTFTVAGYDFRINYNGGDGNDVVLTKLFQPDTVVSLDGEGNLTVTDAGASSNDTLTLSRDGAFYLIRDDNNLLFATQAVFTRITDHLIQIAVADVTGDRIQIDTGDGDDLLTINFATGTIDHDLVFNGGSQGTSTGDTLELVGGAIEDIEFPFVFFAGTDCLQPDCGSTVSPNSQVTWTSIEKFTIAGRALNAGDLYVETDDASNRIVFESVDGSETLVRVDNREFGPFGVSTGSRLVVFANGGNDVVSIHGPVPARAEIHGGSGNDYLAGNTTDDRLIGGLGNDVILGRAGDDILHGDDPTQPTFGGNDLLEGGGGRDILFAGVANDVVSGNDDNDTLDGGLGHDSLMGGEGNDFNFGGSDDATDFIDDDLGDDVLFGGGGVDQLFGGGGRDLVIGGIGADQINGGDDDDLIANGSASQETAIAAALMLLAAGDNSAFDAVVTTAIDQWRSTQSAAGFGTLNDDGAVDLMIGGNGADAYVVEPIDDFSSLNPIEGDSQV